MAATLLRTAFGIHCLRVQIFGHLNAFDSASLVEATRIKSLIRPVERVKFLHAMRAVFTEF